MAIIEGGTSATLAGVGAQAQAALHAVLKPDDAGSLGHYAVGAISGAIGAGAGANSEVFQLRWTDATRLCLIHRIRISGLRATTAFAAGAIDLRATIARSWTVDGTGGTPITLTGNNQKLRTSLGTSLMGGARIASTAALGAGTKTLDAQDIGTIVTHSSGGWNSATPIIGSIFLPTLDLFVADRAQGIYPVTLAQNEGLVVRATVPATGVWNIGVDVVWSEVAAY